MFRLLGICALALWVLPQNAIASEITSHRSCECVTTWPTHVSITRHRTYRLGSAYQIGYDPLPYRYGSTYVFEPPYRYVRR